MKRPIDPRTQGYEPQKVLSRKETVTLTGGGSIALETINGAWNRIVKDHESRGQRVIEGPEVKCFYSSSITLVYTYEWDNWSYVAEKALWDTVLAAYEIDLAAWQEFETERKKNLEEQSKKSIDDQIVRAEHRLANLKAAKAGEPIPFPKG